MVVIARAYRWCAGYSSLTHKFAYEFLFFFDVMRRLKSEGRRILYVSHRFEESAIVRSRERSCVGWLS